MKQRETTAQEASTNVETGECVKTTIWSTSVCVEPQTSTLADGLCHNTVL